MSVSSVQQELGNAIKEIATKTGLLQDKAVTELELSKQVDLFRALSNQIHEVADKIGKLVEQQLLPQDQAELVKVRATVAEALKKMDAFRNTNKISEFSGDISIVRQLWHKVWGALSNTKYVKVDKGSVTQKFVESNISERVLKAFFDSAPRAANPKINVSTGVWGVSDERTADRSVTLWVETLKSVYTKKATITPGGIEVEGKTYPSWEAAAQSIDSAAKWSMTAPQKRGEMIREVEKHVCTPRSKVEGDAWYLTRDGDGYTINGGSHDKKKLTVTPDGQVRVGEEIHSTLNGAGLDPKNAVAVVARKAMETTKKILLQHGVDGHLSDLWNLKGTAEQVFVFEKEYEGTCIKFDEKGIRRDVRFSINDDGKLLVGGEPLATSSLGKTEAVGKAKNIAGTLEQIVLDGLATKANILADNDKSRVSLWLSKEERVGTFWIEGVQAKEQPVQKTEPVKPDAEAAKTEQSKGLWGRFAGVVTGSVHIAKKAVGHVVSAGTAIKEKLTGGSFPAKEYTLRYYDPQGILRSVVIQSQADGFKVKNKDLDIASPTVKGLLDQLRSTLKTPKSFEQMMAQVVAKETKAMPILEGLKGLMGMGRDSMTTSDVVAKKFEASIGNKEANNQMMMYLVWQDAQLKYHVSVRNPTTLMVTEYQLDVVSKPGKVVLTGGGVSDARECADVKELPKALHTAENLKSEVQIADPNLWDPQLQSKMQRWKQLQQLCYPESGMRVINEASYQSMLATIGDTNAPDAFFPVLHEDTVELKCGKTVTVTLPSKEGEPLKVNSVSFSDWKSLLKAMVGEKFITPPELVKMANERTKAIEQLQSHGSFRSDDGSVEFARITESMKSDVDVPKAMWLLRDEGQVGFFRWMGAKARLFAPPKPKFFATLLEGDKKTDIELELVHREGKWMYKVKDQDIADASVEGLLKRLPLPEGADVAALNRRRTAYKSLADQIEGNVWIGSHNFYASEAYEVFSRELQDGSKKNNCTAGCVVKDTNGLYQVVSSTNGGECNSKPLLIDSNSGELVFEGRRFPNFTTFRDKEMNGWKSRAEIIVREQAETTKPAGGPPETAPTAALGEYEEGTIGRVPEWLGQKLRDVVKTTNESADKRDYTQLIDTQPQSLFRSSFLEEGARFHLWVKALGYGTVDLLGRPDGAVALTQKLPSIEQFMLYALCVSGNVMGGEKQKKAKTIIENALRDRLIEHPEERDALQKHMGMLAKEYEEVLGSRAWKQVSSLLRTES